MDLITKNLLRDIGEKINVIHNNVVDNREVLIKLVQQSNQIASVLGELLYGDGVSDEEGTEKRMYVDELIEKFYDAKTELEELEKELEKHKDNIIKGSVGES